MHSVEDKASILVMLERLSAMTMGQASFAKLRYVTLERQKACQKELS